MTDLTSAPPTETSSHAGLAYALWLPEDRATIRGGIVILHGGGAAKERHFGYARLACMSGFAAVCFDLRGHGASTGPMGGGCTDDVCAIATLLRERIGSAQARIALRGSSLGGYLALVSATAAGACAVVAICPAPAAWLRRALETKRLPFDLDAAALDAFFAGHDLCEIVGALDAPLLLLHADGDKLVPVDYSRELAGLMRNPASRLIVVAGGGHGTVQHDAGLQAESLRFIAQFL